MQRILTQESCIRHAKNPHTARNLTLGMLRILTQESYIKNARNPLHRKNTLHRNLALGMRKILTQQPFDESAASDIHRVKKRVSKMLGIFSRARPSLAIESANRLFKSMILPILDYCGAVFHMQRILAQESYIRHAKNTYTGILH